ncbi:SIMPL domain-containing protein [Undibacterium sp. TS12]|uniref:SIMPL domain-containing protein n=1 Tax=Undibacterium sp. TS12 TaxID=2908202 RepID=UPI001F4D1B76|nr:SIMPL domain-containing protein [Undibacterium sp. TS12]MCH8618443.1 SIMPL domain-containing protein [Undibacterium sp. TS12]
MFRYFRCCALVFLPMIASAGSLPAYPFIHVNGNATITLPADIAELDFELTAFTTNADESLMLLNSQSEDVLVFLLAHKIVAADVEAHDTRKLVAVDEMAASDTSMQRFRLVRSFHVYARNLEHWNTVTQYLLSRPYLGNFSVRFGRTDYAQIEHQLTSKAAENARDRAKELAAGFSVKLLGPTAVSEQALSRIDSELGLDGFKIVQTNADSGDKPTMSDLSLPGALIYKKSVNVILRTR